MGSGIIERWHPVTGDYGLIRTPMEHLVREFLDWQTSINIRHSKREVTTDLATALEALPPLSAAKRRRLFVATSSGWIACFQNGISGSDPVPAMSFLAGRMGVLAMRVCSTRPGAMWLATIWEVYAPASLGGQPPLHGRRSICAMNDGSRWVFEQSGEPYPFEKLATYEKPRKRERFTHDLLLQYLAHFDVRPFVDDFFVVNKEVPAILLERSCHANDALEFSLEDVIAGKPWNRE